jgi:hypothetical protein
LPLVAAKVAKRSYHLTPAWSGLPKNRRLPVSPFSIFSYGLYPCESLFNKISKSKVSLSESASWWLSFPLNMNIERFFYARVSRRKTGIKRKFGFGNFC